jgi:hypothetical protein
MHFYNVLGNANEYRGQKAYEYLFRSGAKMRACKGS